MFREEAGTNGGEFPVDPYQGPVSEQRRKVSKVLHEQHKFLNPRTASQQFLEQRLKLRDKLFLCQLKRIKIGSI